MKHLIARYLISLLFPYIDKRLRAVEEWQRAHDEVEAREDWRGPVIPTERPDLPRQP